MLVVLGGPYRLVRTLAVDAVEAVGGLLVEMKRHGRRHVDTRLQHAKIVVSHVSVGVVRVLASSNICDCMNVH